MRQLCLEAQQQPGAAGHGSVGMLCSVFKARQQTLGGVCQPPQVTDWRMSLPSLLPCLPGQSSPGPGLAQSWLTHAKGTGRFPFISAARQGLRSQASCATSVTPSRRLSSALGCRTRTSCQQPGSGREDGSACLPGSRLVFGSCLWIEYHTLMLAYRLPWEKSAGHSK